MPQTLNVALIGFGRAGRNYHAPLIAAVEGLRLAAVVSSRPDEVLKSYPGMTVYASPDQAFADPAIDLVTIATPNDSHFPIAAAALAHGKHVVIDKPFATTAAETRELIARADQAGRHLSVYQNRRWDADFLTLRRLIAQDALGEIAYFESRFDRFRLATGNWREKPGPSNGLLYDVGAHLADQALILFGKPQAVFADLAVQRQGVATPDYFHVLLRYENRRAVLTSNFMAAGNDLRFIVHGRRASFVKCGADTQEADIAAGRRPGKDWGRDPIDGETIQSDGSRQIVPSERGNYPQYYIGVRDAIRGLGPLPVTAAEGLAVMELLECAEQSATERREIPFA